jgi:hypothetical protein
MFHALGDNRVQAYEFLKSSFRAFIANYNPKKDAPIQDVPQMFFAAFFESLAGGTAPDLWRSFRRAAAVVHAFETYPGDHDRIATLLDAEFLIIKTEKPPTLS